jgi:hypothetical protein
MSVISASLAALIAVEAGFKAMIFIAVLAYSACFLSLNLLPFSRFKK